MFSFLILNFTFWSESNQKCVYYGQLYATGFESQTDLVKLPRWMCYYISYVHVFISAATSSIQDGGTSPPVDKYELFVHPKVQSLLRKLTEVDPKRTLPDFTSLDKSQEITLFTKDQLIEVCHCNHCQYSLGCKDLSEKHNNQFG